MEVLLQIQKTILSNETKHKEERIKNYGIQIISVITNIHLNSKMVRIMG